jgi:FAD/FMN-containing dehydrogenase
VDKLMQPGDTQYDDARALYNGMTDKRPRLIARCVDAADIVAAVSFGREQGLRIAIRGGGHNRPRLGSVNDGLVIDLSQMKGVRVDPGNRTIRVGPGCTSGDVDHATHAYGLAVPFGIVSSTGVAGLTLGGGAPARSSARMTVRPRMDNASWRRSSSTSIRTSNPPSSDGMAGWR